MRERQHKQAGVPLATIVYSFVVAAVLLVSLTAAAVFWSRSDRLMDDILDQAVSKRTEGATESFSRVLYSDWVDLGHLAKSVADQDPATITALLNGVRGDGARIAWVGYAGVDGTVKAASSDLLVGADVSQRPWFRSGLQGGFAGDVHKAVLLAQKLQPNSTVPLRFIDLALPVRDANGAVKGVVGMHIDAKWAEEALAETARMMGLDLYLLSQSGELIMSSDTNAKTDGAASQFGGASSGTDLAGRQVWADGKAYFTALVPGVGYKDLPSFGWRMAGRLTAKAFRPGINSVLISAGMALLVAFVAALVLTFLFVRLFLRPISTLAEGAHQMAEGQDIYPPEDRSSREASKLSDALAIVQVRRRS